MLWTYLLLCEESAIVVEVPVVVPSVLMIDIPDEPTTNTDVCQKSKSGAGLAVVAILRTLQTDLGK